MVERTKNLKYFLSFYTFFIDVKGLPYSSHTFLKPRESLNLKSPDVFSLSCFHPLYKMIHNVLMDRAPFGVRETVMLPYLALFNSSL